jgi:TusA-related sulfurtransferase
MNTPDWLQKEKIKITLDARPMLAQGLHPLEQVQKECAELQPGEIFEIITPFPPSPMIEKMVAEGFYVHSEQGKDGLVHSCFMKKQ